MAAGSTAQAADYPLPPAESRLIGENFTYTVPHDGKPLESTAARFQIGLLGMMEANPGVDPFLPKAGSELIIPAQMLLPDAPREGIVINLAELRLFYYPPGGERVEVYPIGIGQLGRNTPEMVTRVSQHIKDPTWTPTANIRRHYREQGITLPAVMPAGPDNPMGRYALSRTQASFAASSLTDRAAFDQAMQRRSGMPVLVSHAATPVSTAAAPAQSTAPISAAQQEVVTEAR